MQLFIFFAGYVCTVGNRINNLQNGKCCFFSYRYKNETHTHTYDINVEVIHREKKSSSRKAGSGKGRMGKHKRKNMVKNISYTYMKV